MKLHIGHSSITGKFDILGIGTGSEKFEIVEILIIVFSNLVFRLGYWMLSSMDQVFQEWWMWMEKMFKNVLFGEL